MLTAAIPSPALELAVAVLAQLPPAAPTVTSARSYTIEWAVVVVMLGLTLWAVGRPSNRG